MEHVRHCKIDIGGTVGQIRVSKNDSGRYMCIFERDEKTDLKRLYDAYGFMVWSEDITGGHIAYYPIAANDHTKLTKDVMLQMFAQISTQ